MLSPTPPKKKKSGSSSCQVQATSVAFEVSSGVDFLAYGDPGWPRFFWGICMAGGSSDLICLPGLAGYSWTNMTVIGNHHIWNPKLEPFCWLTPPKSIFAASLRQSNGHAFRWFPPPLLRGGFKSWSNRSPACRNTPRDVWNKSACRTAGRTCSG